MKNLMVILALFTMVSCKKKKNDDDDSSSPAVQETMTTEGSTDSNAETEDTKEDIKTDMQRDAQEFLDATKNDANQKESDEVDDIAEMVVSSDDDELDVVIEGAGEIQKETKSQKSEGGLSDAERSGFIAGAVVSFGIAASIGVGLLVQKYRVGSRALQARYDDTIKMYDFQEALSKHPNGDFVGVTDVDKTRFAESFEHAVNKKWITKSDDKFNITEGRVVTTDEYKNDFKGFIENQPKSVDLLKSEIARLDLGAQKGAATAATAPTTAPTYKSLTDGVTKTTGIKNTFSAGSIKSTGRWVGGVGIAATLLAGSLFTAVATTGLAEEAKSELVFSYSDCLSNSKNNKSVESIKKCSKACIKKSKSLKDQLSLTSKEVANKIYGCKLQASMCRLHHLGSIEDGDNCGDSSKSRK